MPDEEMPIAEDVERAPEPAPVDPPLDLPPPVLPPIQAPSLPPSPDASVRVAGTSFTWPVPEREVEVGGRRLSLEVALVAALHVLAAAWLFIAMWDAWIAIPDLISGLFADEFSFAVSWLFLMIFLFILYVVGLLGYCAFLLFRSDPVGRGLAVVVCGVLTLLQFSDDRTTGLTLTWLISVACVLVLFVSPWARKALNRPVGATGRPTSVVLSQTIAVSYLSVLGAVIVAVVPGLRYADEVGAGFVAFELLGGAAVAVGLVGVHQLSKGPVRTGRIMVTVGTAATVVGILAAGGSIAVGLGVVAGVLVPLWLLPDARTWLGDKPLAPL